MFYYVYHVHQELIARELEQAHLPFVKMATTVNTIQILEPRVVNHVQLVLIWTRLIYGRMIRHIKLNLEHLPHLIAVRVIWDNIVRL